MRRLLVCLLLAACGNAEPPFAELPLRDTLLADPRLIALLQDEARAKLRTRFVAALADVSNDETKLEAVATDARVSEHDVLREQAGRDADLVVRLKKDGLHARGKALPQTLPSPAGGAIIFEQDLAPGTGDTLALETLALSGRAGQLVRDVADSEGTHRVVRVVGWPAAITKEGDTLYVNASWLVAMATREESAGVVVVTRQSFGLTVESVNNLETCSTQVASECSTCRADEMQCAGAPVLADYATTQAECVAEGGDSHIARYVCLALAARRGDVIACLRKNEPQCVPSANLDRIVAWQGFEAKPVCAKTMERCVIDPNYVHKITCDACRPSCSSPSCNIGSCSPNCRSPGCSGTSCNPGGCNCGSSKVCAAAPPAAIGWDAFAGVPWALLPLVFFWRAARRRP